jgi:hypothetical protein
MSTHQNVTTGRRPRIDAPEVTRRHWRACKEKEDMEKLARLKPFTSIWVIRALALAVVGVCIAASPARAQFTSGSSGIHGVFPPTPASEPIPPNWSFLVWNISTGGVRYCNAYTGHRARRV